MYVGILGGTGPAGQALAARLASVGCQVVIGSRSVERAGAACDELRARWSDRDLALKPGTNPEAAQADLVVVATVWEASAETAASVADELRGKVVVSMGNALAKIDGELRPVPLPTGSVAAAVQEAAPAPSSPPPSTTSRPATWAASTARSRATSSSAPTTPPPPTPPSTW